MTKSVTITEAIFIPCLPSKNCATDKFDHVKTMLFIKPDVKMTPFDFCSECSQFKRHKTSSKEYWMAKIKSGAIRKVLTRHSAVVSLSVAKKRT